MPPFSLFVVVPVFRVFPELRERRLVQIDHVSGRIVGEGKVLLIFRLQKDMVIDPFRCEERRSQVVVTADHPDLQILVFRHVIPDDILLLEEGIFAVLPVLPQGR